jgi:hypothetical protein
MREKKLSRGVTISEFFEHEGKNLTNKVRGGL